MRRRTIGAIAVAVGALIGACGGDDTDESGEDVPEEAGTAAPNADRGDADPDPEPDPGGNASGLLGPSPDPEAMTPVDDPPDANWMLLRVLATATAGGGTVDFLGFDPVWFTEFSPIGRPLYELDELAEHRDRLQTAAGCAIIQTADGLVIAQANAHHATERALHSSFSMSDNGDGTVIWGLYNAESGEEWSATGVGEASVRYARFRDPEGWEELGIEPGTDDLYVLIDFEGEANENFSTEKSQASSRVLCHFVQRPG